MRISEKINELVSDLLDFNMEIDNALLELEIESDHLQKYEWLEIPNVFTSLSQKDEINATIHTILYK